MTKLAVAALLWACVRVAGAAGAEATVVRVLEIDGPITPPASSFIHRELARAAAAGGPLVVVRLDTPGGLDTAMRDIVRDILASPIPVATYVAPQGARAASAGTYILMASHLAAMAPATTLGAATPVDIGLASPAPENSSAPRRDAAARDAHTAKAVNDAAAYIRGLAQMRARNVAWAEKAVREAASLSADEALREGVVEIIAKDLPELLRQADGREVTIGSAPRTLKTAQASVQVIRPDWRTRLLAVIANPSVALILMMIGLYGLLFEFWNPGLALPGVVGGICLLLGLYGLQSMPVNYAGLGLLLLGVALLIAEAYLPTFGIVGLGGVTALILGGVLLFDRDASGFGVSLGFMTALALSAAALVALAATLAARARRRPVVTGREALIGSTGTLIEVTGREGYAQVHGERWHVTSAELLGPSGARVRVVAIDGLTLVVASDTHVRGA